jgi:hypothetical protein
MLIIQTRYVGPTSRGSALIEARTIYEDESHYAHAKIDYSSTGKQLYIEALKNLCRKLNVGGLFAIKVVGPGQMIFVEMPEEILSIEGDGANFVLVAKGEL